MNEKDPNDQVPAVAQPEPRSVASICPEDYLGDAQNMEDRWLRDRLKKAALAVRDLVDLVVRECDREDTALDDLRLPEAGTYGYPLCRFMENLGAVVHIKSTRLERSIRPIHLDAIVQPKSKQSSAKKRSKKGAT